MVPPPKPGGNKRSVDIREVVNGVMYLLRYWLPVARENCRDPEAPELARDNPVFISHLVGAAVIWASRQLRRIKSEARDRRGLAARQEPPISQQSP